VGVPLLVSPLSSILLLFEGIRGATMSNLKEQIIAADREVDAFVQGGWALRDGQCMPCSTSLQTRRLSCTGGSHLSEGKRK